LNGFPVAAASLGLGVEIPSSPAWRLAQLHVVASFACHIVNEALGSMVATVDVSPALWAACRRGTGARPLSVSLSSGCHR